MDLLRITTAGSVDDGKSTLIGRLLYDHNALTDEQEALVKQKTKEKGLVDLDYSVITDGLIAEREQGITIDVAHIYFASERRKFIITDSPGHVEYTRNMVTGASNATASIILIDVRKGLLEQSYRHFFISHLLGLKAIVFCVNKMDLANYSETAFLKVAADIEKISRRFGYQDKNLQMEVVPVSSLKGDNVVKKSENMPWYKGKSLDEILHETTAETLDNENAFRFDVQQVYHVQNEEFKDFRGYAGRISSGNLHLGDSVVVLPSGKKSRVIEIRKFTSTLNKANSNDSVVLSLDADLDISRGSLLVKENDIPEARKSIQAFLVWLDEDAALVNNKYILQAGSRESRVQLQEIHYLVPPENPNLKIESSKLHLNDIALIDLKLAKPVFLDAYKKNKGNGAFILIDPNTFNTCAVGFVE